MQTFRNAAQAGLIATSLCTSAAHADRLNAAYVNTQPVPIGTLSDANAASYGQTAFNRFNMMGLSFDGTSPANPILFGQKPALTADWVALPANQPAIAAIASLKANGATVFASVIGSASADYLGGLDTSAMTPNATVCGPGGSGTGNINCAVFYLDKFLSTYGFDGVDLDLENGNPKGFGNLLDGIGQSSSFSATYGLSFAPFVDQNSYAPGIAVIDGACQFEQNGLNDYLDARQYYAGGTVGDVPSAATNVLKTAVGTTCPNGQALKLDASNYVIGMSPYSVLGSQFPTGRGGPNNCQYSYKRGFPDCAATMEQIINDHPTIAGTFVWTIGLLDPQYYACYMGNALNGTSNDCGQPQPIPGDEGNQCGPSGGQPCCGPKDSYDPTTQQCTPAQ